MYQGYQGAPGMNPYGNLAAPIDFPEIFRRVYLWLAVGLTIGFGVAFALGSAINNALATGQGLALLGLLFNPVVMIITIIAYLGLAFAFYPVVQRASPAVGAALFVLITAIFGYMTSAIFVVYSLPSIATAFFITATMFALMTLIGFTTRLDLSKFGAVLFMALIGLIVASVVNFFLHSATLVWIISIVGVVLFSALTAYDTQWIKRNAYTLASRNSMQQEELVSRVALIGAFRLFLDFVNLFMSVLRITGRARR
ncbi:MAG TPA: Bax inhibitor-1/YccA family protein [Ktedonobacterales bacterium]